MRALALFGLLLPLASAAAPYSLLDPAGDQRTEFPFPLVGPALAPHAGDLCDDPANDLVAVHAEVGSDVLRFEASFLDPEGVLTCGGADLRALPPAAGAPWHTIELVPAGESAPALRLTAYRDLDGISTLCVRYAVAAPAHMTCAAGVPPFVAPAVLTLEDGTSHDLRGASYQVRATAMSAYGYEDPKAKPIVLWDEAVSSGADLVVPS